MRCLSGIWVNQHANRIVACSTILFLFFCLDLVNTNESFAQNLSNEDTDQVILQLKWKHQFQFAGYYAAKAKGYYQEAGLDVIIREAPEDMSSSQGVLSGEAEFGVTGPDLLLLRGDGEPVVVLSVIFQHSPMVILAREASGISSIHDIAGKRIMMEYPNAELRAYLQYEGITSDLYNEVLHTFSAQDLIDGNVDAISAYITDEPFTVQQAEVDYLIFNPRASSIDFYGDLLYTTEYQLENYPERVEAFRLASLRGWEYAMDNQEEIIDLILNDYTQRHSREHLQYEAEQMERLILSNVVTIGYMNPGRWQYIADTYSELGMLSPNFNLEGFLYQIDEEEGLGWILFILSLSVMITGLISFIAFRFYSLNKKTQSEIKERIIAEKKVKTLLNEKEILLHEVHHRIKNNMSVMVSLLSMQADDLTDPLAAASLKDASSRLQSMGVLYDKLYLSENLEVISVDDYLKELCTEVLELFPTDKKIDLEFNLSPFGMPIDKVTPLGIIVNELVTNALKHAFKNRDRGIISVGIDKTGDLITFKLNDNGIPDSNENESDGFGMKLVYLLTEQLEGSLDVRRDEGTCYTLTFTD